MLGITYPLIVLRDIVVSGFQIGWPLLIIAFGLAGVGYLGGKNRRRTPWGWGIVLGGVFLFLLNIKIVTS